MLDLDLSQFERAAYRLGGTTDQLPFALSVALNEAAKDTRRHLIDATWPQHVTVRNRRFLGVALRTEYATKSKLQVAIFDQLRRGHLKLHAKGGLKRAKGNLAVPTARISRGASGVRQSQRPRALKGAFRIGNAIVQRVGRGKNKKLEVMYRLSPTAKIKPDVPFEQDFIRIMADRIVHHFPLALSRAMATRR